MNEWMFEYMNTCLLYEQTQTEIQGDRDGEREWDGERERERVYKLDQLLWVHSLMKQTILHW